MSTITKERLNEILREEIARERSKQIELNEFFGLGGVVGAIGRGENPFTGAIKEKIIAELLKAMLGDSADPQAINVFAQILQQFSLGDFKTIWRGGIEQCPLATEKIFMGLCQVMGKEIHDRSMSALRDVPVIGAFSTWLGGDGLLNRATSALSSEAIQMQLSNKDTPIGGWMHANVLPPLQTKVCEVITNFQNKSMADIALGREGDAPDVTTASPSTTSMPDVPASTVQTSL